MLLLLLLLCAGWGSPLQVPLPAVALVVGMAVFAAILARKGELWTLVLRVVQLPAAIALPCCLRLGLVSLAASVATSSLPLLSTPLALHSRNELTDPSCLSTHREKMSGRDEEQVRTAEQFSRNLMPASDEESQA